MVDVQCNDIVYDPTCGTGGFLVAAFDHVKQQSNEKQLGKFKQHCLFGIEQETGVAALAVVNMIFRGDGKNNIKEGNCFAQFLSQHSDGGVSTARFVKNQSTTPPITRVMMNPPFSLKRSTEKEYKFIDQALAQMEDGGILFSVLPYPAMLQNRKVTTFGDGTFCFHAILFWQSYHFRAMPFILSESRLLVSSYVRVYHTHENKKCYGFVRQVTGS